MHEDSEWGRGMHRNDSYWRPPAGFFYPGSSPGRNWAANGRFPPQSHFRYSSHNSNRYTDNSSYGVKWQNFHRSQYHNQYRQSYCPGASQPLSMAPGHRRGKNTRGRGGSRPFPSKLTNKTESASTSSSTVTTANSTHTTQSTILSSTSLSSGITSSSSSSSSHSSLGANPSSRPDLKGLKCNPNLKYGKTFYDLKRFSATVPSTSAVSASHSSTFTSSKESSASCTITSSSSEPQKSTPNLAQSYSVSVSSCNLQKMKFFKKCVPSDSYTVPVSTLAYCESIPLLREILHKKPVVVLERLTEKLIRKKLKHAGLHIHGNWHKVLLDKKRKQKQLHTKQRSDDKSQKKTSLKLILSVNSKSQKEKTSSSIYKDSKDDSPDSENILETKDTKPNTSILVDPKVISLSRPLQTAYSNNSSVTNMPFKSSGRGKIPSKIFHTKISGPLPRHMQIFDLDKLRTKLKGANFGGSSRKSRPHVSIQQDIINGEIIKPSVETIVRGSVMSTGAFNSDSVCDFITSPADSTKPDFKEDSRDPNGAAADAVNADKIMDTDEEDSFMDVSTDDCVRDGVLNNAAANDYVPNTSDSKETDENQPLNLASVVTEREDSIDQTRNNEYHDDSNWNTETGTVSLSDNDPVDENKDENVCSQSGIQSVVDTEMTQTNKTFPESIVSPSEDSTETQCQEKVSVISVENYSAGTPVAQQSKQNQLYDDLDSPNNNVKSTKNSDRKDNIIDTPGQELGFDLSNDESNGKVSNQTNDCNEVETEVQSTFETNEHLCTDLFDSGVTDSQNTSTMDTGKECVDTGEVPGAIYEEETENVSGKNVPETLFKGSTDVQTDVATKSDCFPKCDIVTASETFSRQVAVDLRQSITQTSNNIPQCETVSQGFGDILQDKQNSDLISLEVDNHNKQTQLNSPSSLQKICQEILKHHGHNTDTVGACGKDNGSGRESVAKASGLQSESYPVNQIISEKENNDDSNSQCLMDNTLEMSSEALEPSDTKPEDHDDLSPMCIIANVESGAHIYFSETDSDLKLTPQSVKQEEPSVNKNDTQTCPLPSSQTQTSDSSSTNIYSSSQSQVCAHPAQNIIATRQAVLTSCQNQMSNVLSSLSLPLTKPNLSTTVVNSVPGLYSQAVANRYPVLLTPSVPVYPVPLVSSVIQPVLVTSSNKPPKQQVSLVDGDSKSAKKELKPRPIKPKGSEPIQVVVAPGHISPGPLFPMFLPTVPSAFPVDGCIHSVKESQSESLQQVSPTQKGNELEQHDPKSSSKADDATVKDFSLKGKNSGQDEENYLPTNSAEHDSTNTGIELDSSQSSLEVSSCVAEQQESNQYTKGIPRMVSDLDVMHYDDEEPPVLSRVSNPELCVRNDAVHLPEIQYFDGSFITVSTASDPQSLYLTESAHNTEELSPGAVLHDQKYMVLLSSAETELQSGVLQESEDKVGEVIVKAEPESEERIEVGRLNLRRAHGESSDDSDATLIYSCDEDNTCFEEIFQEPTNQLWPKNAPWTEGEVGKNPSLYEGKLVIVSDIADDGEADGESTSDTNVSNERLSLIITTLRKDLEEKKSDRRQAEKTQTKDTEENVPGAGKVLQTKGKMKKIVKPRKHGAAAGFVNDEANKSLNLAVRRKTYKKKVLKKRENLIVTIQRKQTEKAVSVSSVSDKATVSEAEKNKGTEEDTSKIGTHIIESEFMKTEEEEADTSKIKTNVTKVTKPKRRIKHRLTMKRRKKKVIPSTLDTEAGENVERRDEPPKKKIPKKIGKISAKKTLLSAKLKGKKKNVSAYSTKKGIKKEKEDHQTDSDDSDELPTILPPKRRRLQNNGIPLMMMQNSVGSKGNSSERIMREFPRHNWLEQKINQLQQQASCSPSCEEHLQSQSPLQQSPTHVSPINLSSENTEKTSPRALEENNTANPVSSTPSSPTKDPEPSAEEAPTLEHKDAADAHNTKAELPESEASEKENISLHDALKLMAAEDSDGQLVIDEDEQEEAGQDPAEHNSESQDRSDFKGEGVVETSTKPDVKISDQNPVAEDPSGDNEVYPVEEFPKSDSQEEETPKGAASVLPLDLCVRKSDKSSGGNARPKTHPPVQMVLPQIQQPARPVSTDPTLVKETKETVQSVMAQTSESSVIPPGRNQITQSSMNEALNLTKASSVHQQGASVDLAEMVKGVVMPLVTQSDQDVGQQRQTGTVQLSQTVNETVSTSPSIQSSTCPAQTPGSSSGPDINTIPTTFQVSSGSLVAPVSIMSSKAIPRPNETSVVHAGQLMHAPVPITAPAFGGPHNQLSPYPRPGHPPKNMEDSVLDKEFEKHLKEFKQLEMLAARKEREREALLHLKKRKAMLLKDMKYRKNQQSGDTENLVHGPPPAHKGNHYGVPSHISNTQHRAQVAELRPFQNVPQTMTGHPASNLSTYTAPSHMSQTHTSPSSNISAGPLSLEAGSQRKRSITSEDRRPIVQMINLAMLQRGRKHRRLNDDQHRNSGLGMSSVGTVPTPAHQNKTEVVFNHDADVPSSEITQCPYVKRKTPILEPPGSANRSTPSSAALVPAHSQQPFQTAGSLIVPVRNGADETVPPSYPSASPLPAGNTVSPGSHPQSLPQSNPVTSVHRTPPVNEIHGDPNSKSRNSSESAYNVLHASQEQPMHYPTHGERNSSNTNPPPYPLEHYGNVPPQWSPRMPNAVSQSARIPPQQSYPGSQSVRQAVPHNIHRPPHPHAVRPEKSLDVIDLTKEQDGSKPEMIGHIHGPHPVVVGGQQDAETETSVQRELTAALARRQGISGFEQQSQQHTPMMRRNQDMPSVPHYNTKAYPSHNPLSPQGMPQIQHPNQMYPPQAPVQGGNPMALPTDPPYSMQNRASVTGSQYRMQEPNSVKSALLSHGSKQMMRPPNYPMSTSTTATSYPVAHYQQQRSMSKVPQQMHNNNTMTEGYPRMAEKNLMMPGQVPHPQQNPVAYNEHLTRPGQPVTNQYKAPPQGMNWRPQVPTSVSNVPMSFEKQQQLMMMTRKTQWEQYNQQKHAMSQKSSSHSSNAAHPMPTAVSSMPQVPGANYAMATAAQGQDHASMQQRAAMHQHNMRMMQRGQAPMAAQMQSVASGYPPEGMMIPGQSAAPALIEFQQQESHRRIPQIHMNQPPPRLHQFNGSCVVCGALAMYLCSSCRMVWYCSQTCQNSHWKHHGPECKPVKTGLPGPL